MADPMDVINVGCLQQILDGHPIENPIVQCVQIKPMQGGANGAERYRIVLNDTRNFIQSMIAQQQNHIVTEGLLKKGSICRVKAFQPNKVKERLILVILDLEVLQEYGEPEKIGQPVALDMVKGEEDVKPQANNISGDNFYGQKQQAAPQQQPAQRSLPSRSSAKDSQRGVIYPIEALSPYTNKWTIKARCTFKSEIKHWHNKNGQGSLFSVNFLDQSGEIRATGFNESVDTWYNVLQEGSVYYISCPCRINIAKKQFSNVNNDYEMMFERDTMIEKVEGEDDDVPQVQYNFTPLADLQSIEKDTTIDAIGIVKSVTEVNEIISKTTSKPYSKRELTIADKSGYEVRLTIWGNTAQSFNANPNSVIAFKGLKVSDFDGRTLSLLSSGSMAIDPDIDDAHALKGWYDAVGDEQTWQTHANTIGTTSTSSAKTAYKTLAQVRDENIGMGEEAEYFSVKATVIYVKKESFAYPACLTEKCNKKVTEIDPGQWRCEKCEITHPKPKYRYIMSVNVADHTGMLWLSCFDEVGLMLMDVPADDVQAAREDGDEAKFNDYFQEANCKSLVFRCRAKMDNFGDEQRVRYQVVSANKINWTQEAKKLADQIAQYNIGDESLFVS